MHTLHLGRHAEAAGHTLATPGAAARANPWLWLAGGALLFFLVPLVGTDLLGLQPDLYYLIYFTIAVAWSSSAPTPTSCTTYGGTTWV